jgi:hypothetical protein
LRSAVITVTPPIAAVTLLARNSEAPIGGARR